MRKITPNLYPDLEVGSDLDLWLKIAKKFKFQELDGLLTFSTRRLKAITGEFTELFNLI
jgi:hypothetical protein